MIRYGVTNPNGFTYVMAEDVTGYDPELSSQFNKLSHEFVSIKGQIIANQQNGVRTPAEVHARLQKIEKDLEIAKRLHENRRP